MQPLVVICGRPNVGKSTLFNRILGQRKAIISSVPGTTRDRISETISWQGKEFDLVDTGGLFFDKKTILTDKIINQVYQAIKIADLVLLVTDGKEEISDLDKKILKKIRKLSKKLILVVNKIDNENLRQKALNFNQLGIKDTVFVSALHGLGIGDLLDLIIKRLSFKKSYKLKEDYIKVAICGRPNVGKSTLFNKLTGEEKAIVSEIPGTTRDVVNTKISINQENYLFLDTAGLRRQAKIKDKLDYYSLLRTLKAIKEADIILFLIDVYEGIARQDKKIINEIIQNGKSIIILVNKYDLIQKEKKSSAEFINQYKDYLQKKLPFLLWAPIIFISAQSGKNINKIFDLIKKVYTERKKKIRIKELNNLMSELVKKGFSFLSSKSKNKLFYSTQIKADYPIFVLFVNKKDLFKKSQILYLEKILREKYQFLGTPIKLILKSKNKK